MNATAAATPSSAAYGYGMAAPVAVTTSKGNVTEYLPSAFGEPIEPTDVLGLYMALMEEMSRNGLDASEQKINATRDKIGEAMKELKKQLEEIARRLEEQKDDDDGWGFLGGVVDWVCDAVGDLFEAIGTAIEIGVDFARAPVDIIAGAIKGGNIGQLLQQELDDLTTQGKLSKTIGEAAKGITRFVLDVAKAVTEFSKALMTGQEPTMALVDFGKELWGALEKDILENPAVMEVLGAVAKVAAVALAVATGGVAAVAVGLLILSDINKEYGLAEKAFGKDAGLWVTVGIDVAASVLMSIGTLGADALPGLLGDVQRGASLAGAVVQISGGINTIVDAYEQREIDHMQADAQALMNRLAALQRMLDVLLLELQDRTEGRDRIHKSGAKVAEIQGEAMAAAVYYKA